MANFWISGQGHNTLKGVEGEPHNVPRLPLHLIDKFLREYKDAREGFLSLYPSLSETEQERLAYLYNDSSIMRDRKYDQQIEDDFQTSMNDLRINSTNNHLPRQAPTTNSGLVLRQFRR
jgi:hypothetical protein